MSGRERGDLTIWAEGYREWKQKLFDWDSPEPPFYNPPLRSEMSYLQRWSEVLRETYIPIIADQMIKTQLLAPTQHQ